MDLLRRTLASNEKRTIARGLQSVAASPAGTPDFKPVRVVTSADGIRGTIQQLYWCDPTWVPMKNRNMSRGGIFRCVERFHHSVRVYNQVEQTNPDDDWWNDIVTWWVVAAFRFCFLVNHSASVWFLSNNLKF